MNHLLCHFTELELSILIGIKQLQLKNNPINIRLYKGSYIEWGGEIKGL